MKDSFNLNLEKFDSVCFRYEVIDEIGKGAFGCVYKVFDHKEKGYCALKVIINKPNLKDQANVEEAIVRELN
jgi:dual specificity tyrosine-phosphorylation-regulated kinase 2/3/4